MQLHDFSNERSILQQFVSEMRNIETQKDRMRFRKNLERVGEILAYELSRTLPHTPQTIHTPLGTKPMELPNKDIVVCSILRAGLPLHQGVLNYFDKAENSYIAAYRDHGQDEDAFEIVANYWAAPSVEGKTVLLCDPMLATGRTMENVLAILKRHGTPRQIHIISVIGSKEGISYVEKIFPENTHLWIAAVDDTLNAKGYIVPGLDDAGDLAFGAKLG